MSEFLNIAICEDEKNEQEKITALLNETQIRNTYKVFDNGSGLLSSFEPGVYDLLLMDIYMDSSMTGIDVIQRIRTIDESIPVVFITTSKEFALDSYRLSAMKYIEKPVSKKEIDDALHLAWLIKENAPALCIKRHGIEERIPFSHIMYIEQHSRQVFIYQNKGEEISCYEKLSVLSEQLPKDLFFLSHKSFAVNLSFVKYIDNDLRCFVLSDNKNVPIKRDNLGKAKRTLESFLFNRTRSLE